jgi:RNA-directed DNA polymerase
MDTTTTVIETAGPLAPNAAANGPEDLPDWNAADWRRQEEQVRRPRQRIFRGLLEPDAATSGTSGS